MFTLIHYEVGVPNNSRPIWNELANTPQNRWRQYSGQRPTAMIWQSTQLWNINRGLLYSADKTQYTRSNRSRNETKSIIYTQMESN